MTNTRPIADAIEHSPKLGDGHTHDLSNVYTEINALQTKDGGANSAQFKQDMTQLNSQLHKDGVLPNLQILGVDDQNHVLTKDLANGKSEAQNASAVNDFSGPNYKSANQAAEQALANALGIKVSQNKDGSYDLSSPLLGDPANMAKGIIQTVEQELLGTGGGGGDSGGLAAKLGMNPLLAKAWTGWGDSTEPQAAPPEPAPDPNAPW